MTAPLLIPANFYYIFVPSSSLKLHEDGPFFIPENEKILFGAKNAVPSWQIDKILESDMW